MSELFILYVPVSSREEALNISRKIISEKLAACVNLIPGIASIYEWKREIQEEQENILIIKTLRENVDKLRDRIAELHSYEIPCIAEIELKSINAVFGNWMEKVLEVD